MLLGEKVCRTTVQDRETVTVPFRSVPLTRRAAGLEPYQLTTDTARRTAPRRAARKGLT